MKKWKKSVFSAAALSLCLLFVGCGAETPPAGGTEDPPAENVVTDPEQPAASKVDDIPFDKNELYGIIHLGYQEMNDLEYYAEKYIDNDAELSFFYLSDGDYYLVIPRYPDMALVLFQNDAETDESKIIYEVRNSKPFVIQCNVSDIYPDATIQFSYQKTTAEFSPFISLEDGSLDVGEYGFDLTEYE